MSKKKKRVLDEVQVEPDAAVHDMATDLVAVAQIVTQPRLTAHVTWRHWGAWGTRVNTDGSVTRCIVPAGVEFDVISVVGETVAVCDPDSGAHYATSRGMLHITRHAHHSKRHLPTTD